MPDYQQMYYELFRAITDALNSLDQMNIGAAIDRLKQTQCRTEETYMASGD